MVKCLLWEQAIAVSSPLAPIQFKAFFNIIMGRDPAYFSNCNL